MRAIFKIFAIVISMAILSLPFSGRASADVDGNIPPDIILRGKSIQSTLDKINALIKEGNITQTQLVFIKETLNKLQKEEENSRFYYKKMLNDELRKIHTTEDKATIKEISYGSAGEYFDTILQMNKELEFYKNSINQTDENISKITEMQLRVLDQSLFVKTLPFYKLSAWSKGISDIRVFVENNSDDYTQFGPPGENKRVDYEKLIVSLSILALLILYLIFLNKYNIPYFEEREIVTHEIIKKYKPLLIFILIIKNLLMPALLVYLLAYSFIGTFGFHHSPVFIVYYWSKVNALILIIIFEVILRIVLCDKFYIFPEKITSSHKFYVVCHTLKYLIPMVFLIYGVKYFSFTESLNPVFYSQGTACLLLILSLAICFNMFILIPRIIEAYNDRFRKHAYIFNLIKLILIIISLSFPLLSFFGESNLAAGLIINIIQSLLLILLVKLFFSVFKILTPIVVRYVTNYFFSLSRDKGEEYSPKDTSSEKKSSFVNYWINTLVMLYMTAATIVVLLLIWGIPYTMVNKWLYIIFFKGVPIGESGNLSVHFILRAAFAAIFTFYLFKFIQYIFNTRVLPYTSMDSGTKHAILTSIGYFGLACTLVAFIYAIGVNMTTLTFVISGLSVGIGFAMQELFKNFFSGFVLLVERPIKIGDIISVNDTLAVVRKIRIRSTEIETLKKDLIIIPNSELVNSRLINNTSNPICRIDISVGVAYNSDMETVISALKEAADSIDYVKKIPEPYVTFEEFGDSSLNFILKSYVVNNERERAISDIRKAVLDKIRERGLEIPFPQRDLYVKQFSSDLTLKSIKINDNKIERSQSCIAVT